MKMNNESAPDSTLTIFFNDLSQEDKDSIDTEIFNPHGMPLETMQNVTDDEIARRIMGRLRQYLEWKKGGMSREDLKKSAQDIIEYYGNQFEDTGSRAA